jgi:hypothetical protein
MKLLERLQVSDLILELLNVFMCTAVQSVDSEAVRMYGKSCRSYFTCSLRFTQKCYEIYSVAKTVKAMCKDCTRFIYVMYILIPNVLFLITCV